MENRIYGEPVLNGQNHMKMLEGNAAYVESNAKLEDILLEFVTSPNKVSQKLYFWAFSILKKEKGKEPPSPQKSKILIRL